MFRGLTTVLGQLFSKKSTNKFPAKRAPKSIVKFLEKGKINPPIDVPKGFRGRLKYFYDKCIGCGLCAKVCPCDVIELYPVEIDGKKKKRIVMYNARCCKCQECVDVCPTQALEMEQFFTSANYDKYGDDQVVGIEERRQNELKD